MTTPGSSKVDVCNAFEASCEFQTLVANLYGTAASDNERTEHFVNNFYLGAYGRAATSTELPQQRDALNATAAQSQAAMQTQAETFGRSLFAGRVNDSFGSELWSYFYPYDVRFDNAVLASPKGAHPNIRTWDRTMIFNPH